MDVVDADTVVVLAADMGAEEVFVFIFRASSSGLEAAGATVLLLPGLGSRLMTGMAGLGAVGRGAANRLFKVVVLEVVVEMAEEEGRLEVATGGEGDFSGSGAGVSRTFCSLLNAAFFSSSRSFAVILYPNSGGGGRVM